MSLYVLAAFLAIILSTGMFAHAEVPSHCTSEHNLPDWSCTPGATNPKVTQKNLKDTVCKSGYSKKIRPPTSYTNPLKKELMKAYGIDAKLSDYELDHLIPLSIGGAPKDPKNLWPEKWTGENSAKSKDVIEDKTHRDLCSGKITLKQAQEVFTNDWTK